MRPLSFKTRLWLGHVAVLAAMLALARRSAPTGRSAAWSWGASSTTRCSGWPRRKPPRSRPIPRIRCASTRCAPGAGPPSFARLDKFVQITDLDGRVVARSATLGTARLPTPPALLARVRDGETVFATVTDFGEEPIRMVLAAGRPSARPATPSRWRCPSTTRYAVLRAGRWLFLSMSVVILAGDRLDQRAARAPGAASDRPGGDAGPPHRRGESGRPPAAPGNAGRDRPARRDAQRHAAAARAELRGAAAVHRRRLARAPLAAVSPAGGAGGDASPAARRRATTRRRCARASTRSSASRA